MCCARPPTTDVYPPHPRAQSPPHMGGASWSGRGLTIGCVMIRWTLVAIVRGLRGGWGAGPTESASEASEAWVEGGEAMCTVGGKLTFSTLVFGAGQCAKTLFYYR
jgi:hypothetical protein